MSGKHDRSLDDDQSTKLLLTGPIAIRGLGRSVKDALRPGRPSRHRAFVGDGEEVVEPTPVQQMLVAGPSVQETGPSSDLADAPTTQDASAGDEVDFPADADLPQTEVPDGPREDRVDEPSNDAAPGDDAPDGSAAPEDERTPDLADEPVDAADADASVESEPTEDEPTGDEVGADAAAPAFENEATDDELVPSADAEAPLSDDAEDASDADVEDLPADVNVQDPADDAGEDLSAAADEQDPADDLIAGDDEWHATLDDESATEIEGPALDEGTVADSDEDASQADVVAHEDPEPVVDPDADDAFFSSPESTSEPDVVSEPEPDVVTEPEPESESEPEPEPESESELVTDSQPDPVSEPEPEPEPESESATESEPEFVTESEPEPVSKPEPEPEPEAASSSQPDSDAESQSDAAPEAEVALTAEPASAAEAPVPEADGTTGDESASDEAETTRHEFDEAALDAAAAELLSPDAAPDEEPVEAAVDTDPVVEHDETPSGDAYDLVASSTGPDPVVAEFIGDRGWTTAEELYSRPITLPVLEHTEETPADLAADEVSSEQQPEGDAGEEDVDAFDEAFLIPDEIDQPGAVAESESGPSEIDSAEADDSDDAIAAEEPEREWASADELLADAVAEPGPDAPSVNAISAADDDRSATDEFFAELDEPAEVAAVASDGDAAAEEQAADESDTDAPEEPAAAAAGVASVPVLAAAAGAGAAAATAPAPSSSSGSGGSGRSGSGGSGRSGGFGSGGSSRPPRRRRPMRERFGREVLGIAVLVVLALVCGGLITAVVLKTQRDAAIAASEAANYTPPPLATPEPTATGPSIAVISDATATTAAGGVTAAQKWPALLGSALDGTLSTDAAAGMGYAAKRGSGETFVQAAAKVPANAKVVIVFGGAADANVAPLSLAKAATDTYSAVQKQAPDAKLIVVGPVIEAGVDESDLTPIRNTLRSAAAIAKATWIDPIDAGWLSASKQSASSPTALTAADEKTIATKLEAAVKKALG